MSDSSEDDLSLKIAKEFCELTEGVLYCLQEDSFYLYHEGTYKKVFVREMQDLILRKKALTRTMSLQYLKNIVDRIATIKKCHLDKFNTNEYINFKNGLFSIEDGTLKAHTSEVISTIQIPYEYDNKAICPLWEKSLIEIMEGDKNKIRTLQEFFGYCLTREVKQEKALVLTGNGANGKSTILHTLEHIVGEENCSALSLKYFNNPQKVSVLANKLVNICGEVSKKTDDFEEEFRAIVTGDKLTISPKYVPDYKIKPFCKLVIAANEFPYIDDKTSAFYRRLLMIALRRQFLEEEQNKDLREQLLEERPGIFNWSLEGLRRLRERGNFIIDEYMRSEVEAMREMNNPIMQWAKDYVMHFPGEELIKTDAFEEYQRWSEKSGYKPFGLAKFSNEIYQIFSKVTDPGRRATHGDRPRMWPNLALRNIDTELRLEQSKTKVDMDWKETP